MTPQELHEQRRAAVAAANIRRAEITSIKRCLRNHTVTVHELLAAKPAAIGGYTVMEVLMWQPWFGRERLRVVNARAMTDHVNLMVRVDRASGRTVDWVAEHGKPQR